MFIYGYNDAMVPKSIQLIEYALELLNQYLLKYLYYHMRYLGEKSFSEPIIVYNLLLYT